MERRILVFLFIFTLDASHFNGGTIRWFPNDPYTNDSYITITIIQIYYWTYPRIACTNNVPVDSFPSGYPNANVNCIADCASDGGYSTKPIDILTECVWASSALEFMKSEKSRNITLAAGAHFYASHVGNAWSSLTLAPGSRSDWSIVFSIDLRIRSDAFINTPPKAEIISPQYTFVNQTSEIRIHTTDDNRSDVIRCRWAIDTLASGRRKRSFFKTKVTNNRYRRTINRNCSETGCTVHCEEDCPCICAGCLGTTCTGTVCANNSICSSLTGTSSTIDTSTSISTSTLLFRPAIDECGGICYPSSLPHDTTLHECTISFRGLIANTWYAIALQVKTSNNLFDFHGIHSLCRSKTLSMRRV